MVTGNGNATVFGWSLPILHWLSARVWVRMAPMPVTTKTAAQQFASRYQTHRGLPPLAGLGSFNDAMNPGLSVEESVRRLKCHHYALRRLHQIFLSRIPSEPIYELKMAFSHQAWLCAEQVAALRTRVGEMREPPLGLDKVPHPALEYCFDEILSAATTAELLLEIYEVVLPALKDAMDRHSRETHLLADQPTRRLLRIARGDLDELSEYGSKAVSALDDVRRSIVQRNQFFRPCLPHWRSAVVWMGQALRPAPYLERNRSSVPFKFDGVPRRDARFPDPYNMGVNAEVFLYDPSMPLDGEKSLMNVLQAFEGD